MQTAADVPPYVTVYVKVHNLRAPLSDVENRGGWVLVPPTVISETASFMLFRDPKRRWSWALLRAIR